MSNTRTARASSVNRKKQPNSKLLTKAIKGGICGLVITIVSILAFALLVKQFGFSDSVISAVDQAIKVISICVAAYVASCNCTQAHIPAGMLAGCMYVLFGYLVFSLIQSSWGDVSLLLADLAMGAVIGMLMAMICTRLKGGEKKRA